MSVQSALLTNCVTRIEAVVPRTKLGGNDSFRHLDDYAALEALLGESGATRRFALRLAAHDAPQGHMSAIADETWSDATLEGMLVYELGSGTLAACAAILEDVDDLRHETMRVDGDRFEAGTTKLMRRVWRTGRIAYEGWYAMVPFELVCRYDAT